MLVLSITLVLVLAGAPPSPASPASTSDVCEDGEGIHAVGQALCDGEHLVERFSAPIQALETGSLDGQRFAAVTVPGEGDLALVTTPRGTWSDPLPAGGELGTRTDASPGEASADGDAAFVLVHLATPMTTTWHDALAERGYSVHAYLPVNWFVVDTRQATTSLGELHELDPVDHILELDPALKIEPALAERADASGEVVVNVLGMPGVDGAFETLREAVLDVGGEVLRTSPMIDRVTASVAYSAVDALADVPEIAWIDRGSLDTETDMNKIRPMTGATHVAEAPGEFDGEGVTGMVMDAGIDDDHPDFERSLLAINGPYSSHYHGTATFGIVFGTGDNNEDATGMAPEADGIFAWWRSKSRYAQAADLAQIWDGDFQSHSWGAALPKNNAYTSASIEMDRIAQELDVLPLQSMSNCGPLCARQEAMAKNIISVGALYHYDSEDTTDDEWDEGASTGPADDGRIKPTLVGPYDDILTTTSGGGYTQGFGGTSGATPVAAGAVALTHDMADAGLFDGADGDLSAAAAKALVVASAEPYLPPQVFDSALLGNLDNIEEPWRRNVQGWGLPNLERLHESAPGSKVVDEAQPLETGETFTTTIDPSSDATELRITLTWSDVPGSPSAETALVNDLDLVVTDPTGEVVYEGNAGLKRLPYSVPGTDDPDRLNPVESVFVPLGEHPAGAWTIEVTGAAVNIDATPETATVDQPFALAALPAP